MFEERKKGFLFGTLFGIVVAVGAINIGRYFGFQLCIPGSATQQIYDKVKVIEQCIDDCYQGDVNDEDLANYAAKGMVSALGDKYSQYYTEEEYAELMSEINGSYVGIGVTLAQEADNAIIVKEVLEGGPAAEAGISKGDRFMQIDEVDVSNMDINAITDMIKKENNDGRTLNIKIERTQENGEVATMDKAVVCRKVDVVSVIPKMYGTVGYIKVTGFDKETDEQFGAALENMRKDDVSALVVDVRNNGGGSLDTVVNMLDELLPEGELITEKSKKEGDKTYYSTSDVSFTKPIVVLMNKYSASASEVFAGTLQARKAAKLVGTKSFGKGIVQTVLSFEGSCGGGIKLTTAEYFLPGGISIHQKGLTPDVEVPYEGEETEIGGGNYDESKDAQLQRALEIAADQLSFK